MNEWWSKAVNTFPELKAQLHHQGGPHGLWGDLCSAMVAAYDASPANEDLIRRVYQYAAWCIRQPATDKSETDLPSATAVSFLGNLSLDTRVANDLYRWLSVETFEGCENLFRYHLSEEEYNKLHGDLMRKKKGVANPSVL